MNTNTNTNNAKVVFMGSGEFALKIFSYVLENGYDVIGFYTQPPKKSGREHEIRETPIETLAKSKNIKIYQPDRFGDSEIEELKDQKPDVVIVVAYGKILPEAVLDIPKRGAINVHASLLPKFRGPSPMQNAILSGEKSTGTTVMLMDKGIDTGDIIAQKEIQIGQDETFPELFSRLAEISSELLIEILPQWIGGKIKAIPQNDEDASLCQLIERADGKIEWAEDAEHIYNKYRAFLPWPGIFSFWQKGDSNLRLKLNKISIMKSNPETRHTIGEVFQIADKIGVQTNRGVVIIEEVQLEGKNKLPVADFMNGNTEFLGSVLK